MFAKKDEEGWSVCAGDFHTQSHISLGQVQKRGTGTAGRGGERSFRRQLRHRRWGLVEDLPKFWILLPNRTSSKAMEKSFQEVGTERRRLG